MENPMQDQERFFAPRFKSKSYYDSPEGEDLGVKLLYTTKIAGGFGLVMGALNAYYRYPLALGHKQKLFRVGQIFLPCVGMATAFTLVTYFATNIRKKDDQLNYFLGGCGAGSIFGVCTRSFFKGFIASVALGLIGVAQKMAKENNMVLLGVPTPKGFSSYYARNWDFTLTKDDIRGNWTRDPK